MKWMNDLLPPWPLLAAFFAASLVLAITPGPGVLYIVTRSLSQGRRSGFTSVAGVALGNLGNAIGAAIGLGAVLAVSATAFLAVKYAGALYLVYLGIRALRNTRSAVAGAIVEARTWKILRDGFLVALLNPKTALFFAAFLPQFIVADEGSVLQTVALGALFVSVAAITDAAYVVACRAVAPFLSHMQSTRSFARWVAGGTFIGLGVATAIGGDARSGR
jgi:threonine/homoserine/homoserine lactone efflux protein